MGPHGGFELWRCPVYGGYNFSPYIHAGIVVIALLGGCYAEPNVNHRSFDRSVCPAWIAVGEKILPEN
jgi:hypothetical protein